MSFPEKGLPPLSEHDETADKVETEESKNSKQRDPTVVKAKQQGLSFSSSSSKAGSTSKAKRKAAALLGDSAGQDEAPSKAPSKKKKKQDKKLLSFGDDA